MRTSDFHLYTGTTRDRVSVHGDYLYHGIRFEYTLRNR